MKKSLLSFILFAVFSLQANAQIFTNCNPQFGIQFLTANTVKLNPLITTDSPFVQHYWNFGNGMSATSISPVHTYAAGTYNIRHHIIRTNQNGVFVCADSMDHQITIIQPAICNLTALFTYVPIVTNPQQILFTNMSGGFAPGDSIRWTFGDGTVSYLNNPVHTYTSPGNYIVCLRVKKPQTSPSTPPCISEICIPVQVALATINCNLQAYFTTDSLQPNIYRFNNQSPGYLPTDSIRWSFGDGTFSGMLNPTHTYTSPGIYTACLRIIRYTTAGTPPCIREYCKVIIVPQPSCNLTANFTWYADSTASGMNLYHFTNTSVPVNATDSIRWTFGDGTTSNLMHPNHAYAQPGTYIVCLRIIKRNNLGALTNCIREVCHTITIAQPCNLVANFTWYRDSAAGAIHKYHFTNTSAPLAATDSIRWTFGDGTSSNQMYPNHVYAQPGTYIVCLRVQKRNSAGALVNCIREICKTVIVQHPINTHPPCTQLSKFTFSNTTANSSTRVFTPDFISPDIQYTWTFGDGTGAQTPVAMHTFPAPGYYTVCLTAFKNNNCASTTCKSVYIGPNCNNITLGFTQTPDSLVPNRIKFTANSNNLISNQSWTITKLPVTLTTGTTTINQMNPTYMFLDSGSYRVCLRVVFPGGCVKEYCKIIHISQSMPTTSSCAVQVYPNPTSSIINAAVTLTQPLMMYAFVYNSMNMQVAQKQQQGIVGNNIVSIPVNHLPAGVYTLRLIYGNHVCSSTFIKQ